jgi:hypothetical protein
MSDLTPLELLYSSADGRAVPARAMPCVSAQSSTSLTRYREADGWGGVSRLHRGLFAPALCAGDLVVMDNLASHKVAGVREAIEAQGADVGYLPAYRPALNPIEKRWAKMKARLRCAAVCTLVGAHRGHRGGAVHNSVSMNAATTSALSGARFTFYQAN